VEAGTKPVEGVKSGLLAHCTALKAEDIYDLIKQLSEALSQERLRGENHCFK
jgi:hypothetical protein